MMNDMMCGIAASPGIAMGRVLLKIEQKMAVKEISVNDIVQEIERLKNTLIKVKDELREIKNETTVKLGEKEAEIFQVQLMLLNDPEFIPAIENKIRDKGINAEFAVEQVIEDYAQMFADIEDEYMRGRETDVRDVGKRIIKSLLGREEIVQEIEDTVIVVAENLTPSETVQLDTDKVLAIVTRGASRTSHAAILARSLAIPAVVGVGAGLLERAEQVEFMIVDGRTGRLIFDPDQATLRKYEQKLNNYKKGQQRLNKYIDKKAITKDGKKVKVVGNIGSLSDVKQVLAKGGEGIGLFRTEFLYMNRDRLPTEEEQYKVYHKLASKMGDKPVVIRTLDIGGDKDLSYLNLPQEMNPFLGYRAIRVYLDKPEIAKPQLRAILRASNYGNLKIMYPLISSIDEVRMANKVLKECKRELDMEGQNYNSALEVGVMIEVPAAVMISDIIAKEVNFFSLGSNDLIQYTIAVDRINEKVADLHTPYHPGVLRLIKKTIDTAHQAGIWVGMCGEAAGDELLLPFLLGAELDEFSMSYVSILKIKELISKWTSFKAHQITDQVLAKESPSEVKKYLQAVYRNLEKGWKFNESNN